MDDYRGPERRHGQGEIFDRLVRIEERAAARDTATVERMDRMETAFQRVETKVESLVETATMGRGAWMLLLKLGAVAGAIAAGAAWVLDKIGHLPKP
jgi:hypothetical protein